MQAEFEKFVSEQGLFDREHRLLLALSGGKDSVCLFHLLKRSGFTFEAAHCNFQLRGNASDMDRKFVESLCTEYNIPFHIINFDTLKEADSMGKGIQETARLLRYSWFEKLQTENNFDRILTAHHKSDNTETVLINIIRSTGIAGLHGIRTRHGRLVRPLMFTDGSEIENYLLENRLVFRHDASNDSEDYLRNKLRIQALPGLRAIEPKLDDRFIELSKRVAEFEQISEQLLKLRLEDHSRPLQNGLWISDRFFDGVGDAAAMLYLILRPYGFNREQADSLNPATCTETGKRVFTADWRLIRERNGFALVKMQKDETTSTIEIDGPEGRYFTEGYSFNLSVVPMEQVDFTKHDTLYFDQEKCRFPLTIRTWKSGDRIVPLGMNGSKLVSDLLTDKKTPAHFRANVQVMTDHSETLMAVFPDVCSQLYRLTSGTRTAVAVEVKKP